jgi:para-aminobenzoate synthetase component 1
MSLRRTPLSYCKHSISGFSRVRSLGGGFLLDSGHGYPDHIDVYSAAPAVQVALASATAAELDAALSRLCDPLEKYQISGDHSLPMPGWYGVWSYDLGQITESIPLDITNPRLPLMWMGFYPSIVVTDHKAEQTWLLSLTEYEDHARELLGVISSKSKEEQSPFRLIKPFEGNLNAADYASLFQRVQHYIHGGDCYQINLSQCYSAPYTGSVWRAYQRIRASLSAPMGAYFEVDDWALLSVSPERFIRCDKGNVETKPIKGTRPRGLTPEEDQLLLDQLRNSAKDRAENLMIVDLLRNDLDGGFGEGQ